MGTVLPETGVQAPQHLPLRIPLSLARCGHLGPMLLLSLLLMRVSPTLILCRPTISFWLGVGSHLDFPPSSLATAGGEHAASLRDRGPQTGMGCVCGGVRLVRVHVKKAEHCYLVVRGQIVAGTQ